MAVNTQVVGYAAPAKFMHWLMAIAILGMVPAGLVMVNLNEGPLQDQLFANHESLGFLLLLAIIARLIVRQLYPRPPKASVLSPFERKASTAAHHILYMLMVAMPILGWAGKSAYGAPLSVFGLFTVPPILPKNEAVSNVIWTLHQIGGYFIAFVLVAHIGGALMHLLVKKDGVFQRMWPGKAA